MKKIFFLFVAIFALIFFELISGPVDSSVSDIFSALFSSNENFLTKILWEIRIPTILTAILAGASMSLAGLLVQTYFENPLADPFILGLQSGSGFFLTLFILFFSTFIPPWAYSFSLSSISLLGSFFTLILLLFFMRFFSSPFLVLILGLILGYFFTGLNSILYSMTNAEELKNFFIWSMGSFSKASALDLKILLTGFLFVFFFSLFLAKPLNLLLLGEDYALSLGLKKKKLHWLLIIFSAILSSLVTAFCGPIAFIGLMAPHLCRFLFSSRDHRILIPTSVLMGILIALSAHALSLLSFKVIIPLNALLGLLGLPFLLGLILKLRKGRG